MSANIESFDLLKLPTEIVSYILSFYYKPRSLRDKSLMKLRVVSKEFNILCCDATKYLGIFGESVSIQNLNNSWLSQFKYVKELYIHSSYITDEGVLQLSHLQGLLLHNAPKITNSVLISFKNKLRNLRISNETKITKIPYLPLLYFLCVSNTKLNLINMFLYTDKESDTIGKTLPNLTALVVDSNQINDVLISTLPITMQKLTVRYKKQSNTIEIFEIFHSLIILSNLTYLYIPAYNIIDSILEKLEKLELLHIYSTSFNQIYLFDSIKHLTKLKDLCLNGKIDIGEETYKSLKSLKSLSLINNREVTDKYLIHLKSLTRLTLSGCNITSAGISKNLIYLKLLLSRGSMFNINELSLMPYLQKIYILDMQSTISKTLSLKLFPELSIVSVGENTIISDGDNSKIISINVGTDDQIINVVDRLTKLKYITVRKINHPEKIKELRENGIKVTHFQKK